MQQKVAEYVANLMMAGVSRGRVAEMGYDYAVSLQTDALHSDADRMINITSKLMFKASELIRDAMPEADKILKHLGMSGKERTGYDVYRRLGRQ